MHVRKLPFESVDVDDDDRRSAAWTVFAIAEQDGSCQVEDFLDDCQGGPSAKLANRMFALIDTSVFDEQGPRRWLGTTKCHESVAGERIFEFIMGNLRVHWFYGLMRHEMVLARAAMKKSKKTPQPLADELRKLKSDYERAAHQGRIIVVKPPGERNEQV